MEKFTLGINATTIGLPVLLGRREVNDGCSPGNTAPAQAITATQMDRPHSVPRPPMRCGYISPTPLQSRCTTKRPPRWLTPAVSTTNRRRRATN